MKKKKALIGRERKVKNNVLKRQKNCQKEGQHGKKSKRRREL